MSQDESFLFFLTKEGHHYGTIKAITFATHITYKKWSYSIFGALLGNKF